MAATKYRRRGGAGGEVRKLEKVGVGDQAGALCHCKDTGWDFLPRKMKRHVRDCLKEKRHCLSTDNKLSSKRQI